MGYPVNPPSEAAASVVPAIIRDLTTTRQQVTFPSGAKWVNVSYRLLPGATAVTSQLAKIVLNATSDADADGKLAIDGAFIPIFQNDDLTFSAQSDSLITRVDIVSEAAVGAEKTVVRIIGGV